MLFGERLKKFISPKAERSFSGPVCPTKRGRDEREAIEKQEAEGGLTAKMLYNTAKSIWTPLVHQAL